MTENSHLVHSVEMIFPDQANHYGTLFAGNALNLLSKAAFLAASRHSRQNVVMAACSQVTFHRPVRVGQALEIQAHVVRSGRSSMTVEVTGTAEVIATAEQHAAIHGRFEMVAVDVHGAPVAFRLSASGVQSPPPAPNLVTKTATELSRETS
jgi:acyl-CoA hydrolase